MPRSILQEKKLAQAWEAGTMPSRTATSAAPTAAPRSLRITPREFVFRFPSPEHMLEHYRTRYGPTRIAFGALDEDGQRRLAEDLLTVYTSRNRARDGSLVVTSDYAEVVATVG